MHDDHGHACSRIEQIVKFDEANVTQPAQDGGHVFPDGKFLFADGMAGGQFGAADDFGKGLLQFMR